MDASDRIQFLAETTFIVTCASAREGDARRELKRILGAIDARPLFMKGNLLVRVPDMSPAEVLAAVSDAETETIARVLPLTVRADIGSEAAHLQTLGPAAAAAYPFAEGQTFKVECKRRGHHAFGSDDVRRAVGMHLEAATPAGFSFNAPDVLVFVEIYQDIAFVGCQRTEDVLVKTITKMRKYAPGKRPLNRAEAKLREALKAFDIALEPGSRALDLGAAPGGWTKVLAEAGAEVLAVDPAELDPVVTALPNVTHFQGYSQDVLELPDVGPFAIITNDMNRDAAESAGVIVPLLPLLEPEGVVIMTVKFMTGNRRSHIAAAGEVLGPSFGEVVERHLPHNARETTICCRRPTR